MAFQMVMCTSCGEFVPAYDLGDGLEVALDECPDCESGRFKDTVSGQYVTASADDDDD